MKTVAKTPPMGWNSWDCYGASVTEEELIGNADYMAQNLKSYGWEYVVCDIQWYEPTAQSSRYHKFAPLEMDEYSRLIPATNRFPSAENDVGFAKIAEYVHGLGLKFGIHIMRGIPRQAVHQNTPLLGTKATARDIAHPYSICSWNTDMYGVDHTREGAQEYYNSIFNLYAQWGVDFVKVDDICTTKYKPNDEYSASGEIELIRHAIDQCGRDMVLSLSPGAALLSVADHLAENSNMWRMTDDYWDRWIDLYHMFDRCNEWSSFVKENNWPDCDMLPLGHIGIRAPEHNFPDRFTNFTKEEQYTMMTLWCIFRSPLMMGGEMRDNDAFTLALLTNQEVLRMSKHGFGAKQISRDENRIVWSSKDENGSIYVGLFNAADKDQEISVTFDNLGIQGSYLCKDLWKAKELGSISDKLMDVVPSHGVTLYRLNQ